MRRVFALTMMLLALLYVAAAQTPNTPVVHLQQKHSASVHPSQADKLPASAPSTAEPLLFYGGDTNTDDPNDDGFANGNTLLVPTTAVYGAITVPSGGKVVAAGILFNQIATQSGDIFDPATATFDVRSGVSEGNGGKEILHGSGPQTALPTGRQPFGYTEYATSVSFTKQLTPASGATYFVNLSSQCTDSGNSVCSELQYYADNTTQQTNGISPNLQPSYSSFFNSAYFGYDWANVCDLVGGQSPACEWQSFGIYGVNKGTGVIFYSGDFNPSNTLANGLLNQNVSGNDGEVWVPFSVAKQITISYLFINELFSTIPPAAAPATWTIVNGFSEGNPGKIQCQGSGTAYSSPTGRTFTFDGTTYTELQWTEVVPPKACVLGSTLPENSGKFKPGPLTRGGCPGGCALNMSVEPDDPGAPQAVGGFISDVEDNPPLNHVGLPNINDDSFFSSSAYGFTFAPAAASQSGVCGDGDPLAITNVGCDMFSIGIGGTGQ